MFRKLSRPKPLTLAAVLCTLLLGACTQHEHQPFNQRPAGYYTMQAAHPEGVFDYQQSIPKPDYYAPR